MGSIVFSSLMVASTARSLLGLLSVPKAGPSGSARAGETAEGRGPRPYGGGRRARTGEVRTTDEPAGLRRGVGVRRAGQGSRRRADPPRRRAAEKERPGPRAGGRVPPLPAPRRAPPRGRGARRKRAGRTGSEGG